jgi:hypothetical protein
MALIMGIILPLAETVRRIEQIASLSHVLHWLDDYILGALLIAGALSVRCRQPVNPGWLIATWGVAAGALFLSLTSHIQYYIQGTPDPGIFTSWLVLLGKAAILAYMVIGLWLSVRGNRVRELES